MQAPFYDVVVQQSGSGATGFQPESGPGGKDGFYHHMTIGLMARNPHGHGLKGVEQLDPSVPVEIDLDVKRLSTLRRRAQLACRSARQQREPSYRQLCRWRR